MGSPCCSSSSMTIMSHTMCYTSQKGKDKAPWSMYGNTRGCSKDGKAFLRKDRRAGIWETGRIWTGMVGCEAKMQGGSRGRGKPSVEAGREGSISVGQWAGWRGDPRVCRSPALACALSCARMERALAGAPVRYWQRRHSSFHAVDSVLTTTP